MNEPPLSEIPFMLLPTTPTPPPYGLLDMHLANARSLWAMQDAPNALLLQQAHATYRMYLDNEQAGLDVGIRHYLACLPPRMASEFHTAQFLSQNLKPTIE